MTLATERLRHPTGPLRLGVDGYRHYSPSVEEDGCCPDPLCAPICSTICSFVDLLPEGPMWDRQKEEAKASAPECGGAEVDDCPTMAKFAVYGARVLRDQIDNILWPTIRESNPATAVTTLDDWLDRYGWQDCYRSFCRDGYLAMFSPYEREGDCGSEYCPPEFSDEFECAMKHGILVSLTRAQRGGIKNLDWLNWVIAPLGASIQPRRPWPDNVARHLQAEPCEEDDEGTPCFCDVVELELCNVGDTLPGCPVEACGEEPSPAAAVQPYACEGEPTKNVYPAVFAAECIIRSLLRRKCPNIIYRCDEVEQEA